MVCGKNWLPVGHDFRTRNISIIPIGCTILEAQKTGQWKDKKHPIHKAMLWKKMLDDGDMGSLSEIAQKEGLTRARVTQVMNLLRLPTEFREFLTGLEDPKEIRKYSERRLRNKDFIDSLKE